MKTNFFNGFTVDLQTVKKRFKELALIHHPDKGGDLRTMQLIIDDYEYIIKNQIFKFSNDYEKNHFDESFEILYTDVIQKLIFIPGINIELCGNWLWISGLTYPVKDQLKGIGCLYSPSKMMWYFRPEDYKRKSAKSVPIDSIRAKFGSEIIFKNENKLLF